MCGLVGIVSPVPLSTAAIAAASRMVASLRHRGPDGEGIVLLDSKTPRHVGLPLDARHGDVLLGFRRLAILELGPGGDQPMLDTETGNWLTFNGEIYNYLELRAVLEGLGHVFRSGSDTEVILKAYAEWGVECLHRFNGMWALALWDTRQKRLFCARDRFGEKQLYFRRDRDGAFAWCSEIRPLLTLATSPHRVRDELVWDFLNYGLADHTEHTFFDGVDQLLPGHFLLVRAGEEPSVTRYYELTVDDQLPRASETDLEAHADRYRELLHDAVRLRMRSDVQVASFLSGGMDSSSIVYEADRILRGDRQPGVTTNRLRTFTNGYTHAEVADETDEVRKLVPQLREVDPSFIRSSSSGTAAALRDLVRVQEQPFHNASILASYHLLKRISDEQIKVVLTGEGGDETLAGYYRVYLSYLLHDLVATRDMRGLVRELRSWGSGAITAIAKAGLRSLPTFIRHGLARALRPVPRLLRPDFDRAHREREQQWSDAWRSGSLQHRLAADVTRYNLPQLLRHLDRNSMAFSVECRVPFLDHRLIELAFTIPGNAKMHAGFGKYVLRRAMEDSLPDSIVWNRRKTGFGHAEQLWFFSAIDVEELRQSGLDKYLDVSELARTVARPGANQVQDYWLAYSLGLWLNEFAPQVSA